MKDNSKTKWFSKSLKACIALLAFLLLSLIADRIFGSLGYSAKLSRPIAHPPNYVEFRNHLEFAHEFRTNSQGLRYPEISLKKPNSEYRFLVLGDSVAEGYGVESHQTFSALLEQQLSSDTKKIRFINCGVSSSSPITYARVFFHIGLKYDPDAVLIVLHANDLTNTRPMSKSMLLKVIYTPNPGVEPRSTIKRLVYNLWPNFYMFVRTQIKANSNNNNSKPLKPQEWIERICQRAKQKGISEESIAKWRRRLPINLVKAAVEGRIEESILFRGLLDPDYWVESLDIQGRQAEAKWRTMIATLSEIIKECRKRHLWVGLMLAPSAFQFDPNFGRVQKLVGWRIKPEWISQPTELEKRLYRWSKEQNLPFLNLTPYFRKASKEKPGIFNYRIEDRFTPQGHQLIAFLVLQWLIKERAIPE